MPVPLPSVTAAALGGYACSMRSMSGPAVLAARGAARGRLRTALVVAGLGEVIVDKLPMAPNRTDPPAWAARIVTGALTGLAIAGPAGTGAAGVAAAAGTWVNFGLRRRLGRLLGRPDLILAVAEDAVCFGTLTLATRGVGR